MNSFISRAMVYVKATKTGGNPANVVSDDPPLLFGKVFHLVFENAQLSAIPYNQPQPSAKR